jgi:hypothetical protein
MSENLKNDTSNAGTGGLVGWICPVCGKGVSGIIKRIQFRLRRASAYPLHIDFYKKLLYNIYIK